jgi:hypothetical protein
MNNNADFGRVRCRHRPFVFTKPLQRLPIRRRSVLIPSVRFVWLASRAARPLRCCAPFLHLPGEDLSSP